jgi:2-amino-4-hydroxy-6-hydroxymethyldihydropteridine diphosphokinase
MRAWIGLGSNIGDRHDQIRTAATHLTTVLDNLRLSQLIETPALDRNGILDPASPSYVNAVAVGDTSLAPRELFLRLLEIERVLGRPASEKSRYLPRTIDLDILRLEDESGVIIVNDPDLVVPHPRLKDRPFLEQLASGLTS